MQLLDNSTSAAIITKLPDNFPNHYTEIPAKDGVAYRVSSFTKEGITYRCAVNIVQDLWMAKCECSGWPRTKKTEAGKHPCKHIVGAMLCQNMFPLDVNPLGPAKPQASGPPDEPPKDEEVPSEHRESSTAQEGETETEVLPPKPKAAPESSVDTESPFLEHPPDASPLTRSNAVVPIDPSADPLVAPVATIQETRKVFQAFQDAKYSLLEKGDVQPAGDRIFIKKSGWRKIALFFGISCTKLAEHWALGQEGKTWQVTFRAVARNGTYHDGTGWASYSESMGAGSVAAAEKKAEKMVADGKWKQEKGDQYVEGIKAKLHHDVRATAETRAKNRAIADLVGGGEVSAEEMRLVGSWTEEK